MQNPEEKIVQERTMLLSMGNSLKAIYDEKKDLLAAKHAIRAYSEATRTAITQVRYKHLTGSPMKIAFLEE